MRKKVDNNTDLKELIEASKTKLYNHMDNDPEVNPDMLDEALDIIGIQSRYIEMLEWQINNMFK